MSESEQKQMRWVLIALALAEAVVIGFFVWKIVAGP